jgi:hypothetical protein
VCQYICSTYHGRKRAWKTSNHSLIEYFKHGLPGVVVNFYFLLPEVGRSGVRILLVDFVFVFDIILAAIT